jgi:hypothetical protein
MLDNAIRESGRLYTARAILEATEHGDVVKFLTLLAEAWLTHFLFPGKFNTSSMFYSLNRPKLGQRAEKKGRLPSAVHTPTIEDTALLIDKANWGDQGALRSLVSKYQGHHCAVTGRYSSGLCDEDVPPGQFVVACEASHILPYSLNDFEDDGNTPKARQKFVSFGMWQQQAVCPDHMSPDHMSARSRYHLVYVKSMGLF